ncbi:MAG: ferritin [Pirellulales bacterium]|nr:ferritin [Pirellulales bacterium]
MLNPRIQEAFNKQINAELFSSYMYLSMAAYFESRSMRGMANWMRVQAQEEVVHATKFFDFIHDRDGQVTLTAIGAPPVQWDSAAQVFEHAYEHECKVTAMIHDLVRLARNENDPAADNFLQWFVTEQVEEEASAQLMVDKLRLVGDNGAGLFMVDTEAAQRAFAPPAPGAAT